MLEIIIIILFSIAILLILLSFFQKDRLSELEKQVEQLSITYMQENYQLKNKIRLLEDELLIRPDQMSFKQNHVHSRQKLLEEIVTYYEQGSSLFSIADKTRLSIQEVESILEPYLQAIHQDK